MDNIEKLIDAILGEAKEEAERITKNSRENIEEIEKLYNKEAAMDRQEIMDRGEKEIREIRQRSLSQMGMETRNGRLAAKRQVMERAYALAEERLVQLPAEQKKALYEKLIKQFSHASQVVVRLNKEDGEIFDGKLKVPGVTIKTYERDGTFSGGLIIKEGTMETACTFEALIQEARQLRETEIADRLFS